MNENDKHQEMEETEEEVLSLPFCLVSHFLSWLYHVLERISYHEKGHMYRY